MKLILAALASLVLMVLPSAAAKRIALIIGNSNYEHVIDLRNPTNDADLMEKTLKDVGFEVTRHNDLDQRGMKSAMIDFARKLREGAEASMFYYAGHGVELNGVNYLVPVDADTQNKEEADIQNVSVNSFLSLSENSKVPLNIVILDACRNNPFRGLRATSNGGLAPVKAPSGTYVAYSTAPGAVANDGEGVNSPFTEALAESIKQPGLTLEGVLKQTRSKVQLATNNEQLPFDSSAITGDFYFVPKAEPVPVVKVEPPPQPEPVLLQPEPVAPRPSLDASTAREAYEAAGDDPDLLRVIVDRFGDTVWAALAAQKLIKLEKAAQAAKDAEVSKPAAPERKIKVEKKKVVAAPAPAVELEPVAEPEPEVVEQPPVEEPVEQVAVEETQPEPDDQKTDLQLKPKKEAVKSVQKREPTFSKPAAKPRAKRIVKRVEPRIIVAPQPRARVVIAPPRKKIIVEPRPRREPEVKPVRAANLPFCWNSSLRRGSVCRDANGRVCRLASSSGFRGRELMLLGCR